MSFPMVPLWTSFSESTTIKLRAFEGLGFWPWPFLCTELLGVLGKFLSVNICTI